MRNNILFINILILISLNIILANNSSLNSSNETIEKRKYISYFGNSTIKTLDDNNFDKEVLKGIFHDFLILFTVKKCDICNDIILTLENVQKKYINNNVTNLKFAKIDILNSGWTSMRFDLERLPNVIYVSNRSYAIYQSGNWTENDIISFIEDKNKMFKTFPKKMGYFDVFMRIFHVISHLLHEKYPFWNEGYSWGFIALFILFFCFVEYLIIKFCCRRTKKEKENSHQHKHQYQQNMNENKNKNNKKFSKNLEKNKNTNNKYKND